MRSTRAERSDSEPSPSLRSTIEVDLDPKAWGFTEAGAFNDVALARRNHPRFDEARRTLNRLDPHRVFTNPFLDRLLPDDG